MAHATTMSSATPEEPERCADPTVRVHDISHVEFIKPDLGAAESYFHDFGLTTVERGPQGR
ncbi:hypothetical protein [Nocardia abscessus]|uniref:hypothetical protein n=1 Tax=Nocardia abscessus TaxID=120957 RepID=UPI0024576238|nr:hypothetical protein [Nocardia abscessus]